MNIKKPKIVFVVAHPDDESLWIGGLLNFLCKRDEVEVYVICMTGKHDPYRPHEFESAMGIIGLKNWFVCGESIPNRGGIPLTELEDNFYIGLENLELPPEDIDLLVTHPFYGDEHLHMQHIQLFSSMQSVCKWHDIPFGFFTTCTIPYFNLKPLTIDMRRDGKTHLINYCLCEESHNGVSPSHFFQFKVDNEIKDKMLQCYQSINQEEHQRGYASWDSHVEGMYVLNQSAANPLEDIVNNMDVPAGNNLF